MLEKLEQLQKIKIFCQLFPSKKKKEYKSITNGNKIQKNTSLSLNCALSKLLISLICVIQDFIVKCLLISKIQFARELSSGSENFLPVFTRICKAMERNK